MLRLLALVGLTLLALPTSAQTSAVCTGGFATLSASVPGARTSGPFPCEGIDLLAFLPSCSASTTCTTGPLSSGRGNDIWGWTDPDSGREYALVGMVNATVFVDVTVPTAPEVLGRVLSHNGSSSTWRDIKVYADHAFIVSEASQHGMQVFDLKRLRGLTADPARLFTPDARYAGVSNSHNIAINEDSGFAYLVGTNTCSGGLHMVDIRTPTAPTGAGCFSTDGYTHDAQCVIYAGPDTQYTGREICFASNEDTVTIVDVTDKATPVQISRGFYPTPGYTHQGWLTDDHRYHIADDELDEFFGTVSATRTVVMDVSDLDNPEWHFDYAGPLFTSDHNLYVRGRYAFLSTYESGTRILDLDNLDGGSMTEVAHFDTHPQSDETGFEGQWSNYPYFASGTIIANDRTNGLFVLRATGLLVDAPGAPAPTAFSLSEATPNPTAAVATLALTVPAPERVRATILDATGREVAVAFDGTVADAATITVDTRRFAAGAYVVRVAGETFSAARRLSVVR